MNIKLLQWNIWRKENPDSLLSLIRKINPDILTLQELIQNTENNTDVTEYLATKLNFNFFYKHGDTWQPAKNQKTSQGNAILSRFPILKTNFIYLTPPHNNPPDARYEGRVYIETYLDIDNKPLTIGTTHLAFSPKFVINGRRKKEIDNLLPIIQSRKRYIFAGDLNSAPDSYTIREISQRLTHAGPDYKYPTWTTKPFDYHGQFKENRLCWRLDYIFITREIKVIKSEIIKTDYSDHLPILLTAFI